MGARLGGWDMYKRDGGKFLLKKTVIFFFFFLIDYLFIQLVYALNGAYCFIFFRKINVGYNRRYRQNDRRDGYNSFFLSHRVSSVSADKSACFNAFNKTALCENKQNNKRYGI